MNTVTLSTKFSSSIRVKNKTFILFLRTPEIIEVYGHDITPDRPMVLTVRNPEGDDPMEFDYTEEFIWEALKAHKKTMKKTK